MSVSGTGSETGVEVGVEGIANDRVKGIANDRVMGRKLM